MIKSRWDEVHGEGGLVDALLQNTSVMIELRLYQQYGDCLAENLKRARGNDFNDLIWKLEGKDWVQVADELEKEEIAVKVSRERVRVFGAPRPRLETPWYNGVEEAARRLRMDSEDLKWEIMTYATRNRISHNGIGQLVDVCDWQRLAERIAKDLRVLGKIYPGRGYEQLAMRKAIKRFQMEWFDHIVTLDSGQILCKPNERAQKKLSRLVERVRRRATEEE